MGKSASAEIGCNTATNPDVALAQGLAEQSRDACRELYQRFAAPLNAFIVNHLGDAEAAEEVLVETFVAAAHDIRRFDPRRATLSAWLYGIARRRIHNEMRRRYRRRSVPAEMLVSMEAVPEHESMQNFVDTADARMDTQRKLASLAAVLSRLEMTILILSYGEEFSVREISQIVGRSERAVYSILHRARNKARERLVDYDV
jgi:RNA polymerase sigma factor (sigma-70 family)